MEANIHECFGCAGQCMQLLKWNIKYKINIELLETEISAAFICYIPNRTKPKSLFSPECWLDYQLGGAAMNGGDS